MKILKAICIIPGCACGLCLIAVAHMFDVETITLRTALLIAVLCVLGMCLSALGYWILKDHAVNTDDLPEIEKPSSDR